MNTKLMFSSASDRWATENWKSSVSMHSVSGILRMVQQCVGGIVFSMSNRC